MHEPGRLDLGAIKGKLQAVLKDKAAAYWEYLRKFVQCKLSKRELDHFARAFLGDENVWIHNAFIRSIMSNARCPYPPIVPQSPARPKRKVPPPPPPKESLFSPSLPPPPAPSSANKKHKKKKPAPPSAASPLNSPLPLKRIPPPKPTTARTKQVAKKPSTPLREAPWNAEHIVLRNKMQRIVTEAGLAGLTQDSIRLMMLAVETYVKRIIHSSKPVFRPHPPKPDHTKPPVAPYDSWYDLPASSSSSSSTLSSSQPSSLAASTSTLNGNVIPRFSTLTLQDLCETGYLHPSLLGEDFVVEQERMSFALM